ncbi:glycosyltransferase [Candidatus Saccharibacteria bacterium]|nr:glycosyltransferase [Candidatus Saccharibacteria bacterium]
MKAKISVIVPVYNVEEYLPKCLNSLTSQTEKDIKIICVDDGSTDGSLAILKEYEKKDKRILVVSKKNGGLSSARNAGLLKCDTEYVMFCDSDDFYAKRMCEKMLSTIEEDESDLATCTQNVIYLTHSEMKESDRNYYRLNYVGKQYIHDELILKTDVSVLNKIFRMSVIQKYDIKFPEGLNNEDFYFYNAYMSVAKSISYVNQRLYNYIRREGSIMSSNFAADKMSMDHLLVAEKLFDFYKKTGFLKKHRDLFWKQWVMSFWFSVEHSSKQHKEEIVRRARSFLKDNYKEWGPEDKGVKWEVKYIMNGDVFGKIKFKIRSGLVKVYKKVSLNYKQQNYINAELENLSVKNEELLDRLENLKGAAGSAK